MTGPRAACLTAAVGIVLLASLGIARAEGPFKSLPTAIGDVLVDPKGFSIYTFDKDAPGKSNCNGPCATNWPPVRPGEGAQAAGRFTIILRTDGTRQWAVDGKPLYRWKRDLKPGDTTGDGFNGVWHVVRP